MEWLANCNPAVVLMESCKGSTVRARKIADLGHDSRLVKGADVKALRNVCQKDDIRDADYIARLFYVPGTKYVFVKNQRQQSLQFLQNEYKSASNSQNGTVILSRWNGGAWLHLLA